MHNWAFLVKMFIGRVKAPSHNLDAGVLWAKRDKHHFPPYKGVVGKLGRLSLSLDLSCCTERSHSCLTYIGQYIEKFIQYIGKILQYLAAFSSVIHPWECIESR